MVKILLLDVSAAKIELMLRKVEVPEHESYS